MDSPFGARAQHSHATITVMTIRLPAAFALALPFAALLAACSMAPPAATPPIAQSSPAAPLPAAPPAAPAEAAYRIDAGQSIIAVTVRRGGLLARMGHDHVVASRQISGSVSADLHSAEFGFRLDQMTVDEPALRLEAGLDRQPPADAIEGTRTNMLTRVLDAERFPLVQLRAQAGAEPGMVRLTITLHGVTRTVNTPVAIALAAGSVRASGKLTLLQTDFGIQPMSVMGGALTVLDPLEMRFSIVATR